MNVAICDDTLQEREHICKLLSEYTNVPLSVRFFESGVQLLEAVEASPGDRFDVVLLDIIMPGLSGMAIAKELRRCDARVNLVFITTSLDYAIEGYEVQAKRYLLKPVNKKVLFDLLDDIAQNHDPNREGVVVKTTAGLHRLDVDDIIYCEVIGHFVYYHMKTGRVHEERSSLEKLKEGLLCRREFMQPHRSFIVNMRYVQSVDTANRTINMRYGKEIPIAKTKRGEVSEMIAAWFESSGAGRRIP